MLKSMKEEDWDAPRINMDNLPDSTVLNTVEAGDIYYQSFNKYILQREFCSQLL